MLDRPVPTPADLQARRTAAAEIVGLAADRALAFFQQRGSLSVEAKNPQDFVSHADRNIEAQVRDLIAERFPQDNVVGEEEGGKAGEAYWIVDPIDGTSNFLSGSPLWGVSLGYVVAGRPVVGAVAAPLLGLAFAAADGLGVLRDGASYTREAPTCDLRLVSLGDSPGEDLEESLALQRTLRRNGWIVEGFHCTCVSMLFAAMGRFDGHLQPVTSLWDLAGGAVICREAGLLVEIERRRDGSYRVWAGTPALFDLVRPD